MFKDSNTLLFSPNVTSFNVKDDFKTDKLILKEDDLKQFGIWNHYKIYRSDLFNANKRVDCTIIQGSAFVMKGKAFLLMGVGGIDFLDSLSHLEEVDGIIGNGNALFLSKDFKYVYSAHSYDELIKCYELENYNGRIKFIEYAEVAPLIFILRSFPTIQEYEAAKIKAGKVVFEKANTFGRTPVKYSGPYKSRLRSKFIATARIVHCARRPTFLIKESLFDSYLDVRQTVDEYKGYFALIYTLWSQELCDVIGMKATRKLSEYYNPTDPITPFFIEIAKQFV